VPCSRHRRASECDVLRLGPLYGFVTVLVGGGGVLLYLRFSKTLGVEELDEKRKALRKLGEALC
jgi:hypothetical protein